MNKLRLHYRVDFNASCGANIWLYPKAYHREDTPDDRLTIEFPLGAIGWLKSEQAQAEWAMDARKHLRSFNASEPAIHQLLDSGEWVVVT